MEVAFRGRRRPAAPSGRGSARSRLAWPRAAGLALVLAFGPGLALPAAAQPQSPTQFVQSMADRVLVVIRDKNMPEHQRKAALRRIFLDAFDTEAIGRFALGRYWRTASPAQQKQYMELFPGYVAEIYAGQFATYSGETFVALRATPMGEGRTTVYAEIRRTNNTKIAVDFRVRREGDRYRVIDAVVEGVSLIVTKRDEFAAVVSRQGMDSLIARMRGIVGSQG